MKRAFLVLLLVCVAGADEETARYFLERATRALDKDKLDEAEKFLKRSIEEQKDYAPTLFGMAVLAQRRGKKADAIKHLEVCLAQKDTSLSGDERKAIKAAEVMLAQLAHARVEYKAHVAWYVGQLLDLATRSAKKNPEMARECWRAVLRVQPDNATAKQRLTGRAAEPGKALFNGKDLEDWTGGDEGVWSVAEGVMRGSLADSANITRYRKEVSGDYAITCELRVVKNLGDNPLCGIVFGLAGSYDHFGMWMWKDRWALERQTGEHKRAELQRRSYKKYRGTFKQSAWHKYRIVRKGKRVTCWVDGQELWSFSGTDRTLDGFVGIWVQEREIEVRSFRLEN